MAKIKMTRSDVNRIYSRVYRAGYCELYPLYRESEAIGYNCGVYGWNWDLYTFSDGIAITSGYRSMCGGNLPERCKKILRNAEKYYNQRKYKTYSVLDKYIARARRNFEKALQEG
jgi:hypothetical protein